MDQLKEFLGLMRRQYFWFILPILLIMSTVGWFLATGNVQKQVASQLQEITGYHTSASQVQNVNEGGLGHPNDEWHAVMTESIAARRKNVEEAWRKKWDRQSAILTWPADAFGPRSANSLKTVEQMRPIPLKTETIQELGPVALGDYKTFVQKQLPRIAEKIGSVWDPTGTSREASSSRRSVDSGATAEVAGFDKPIIVDWNPESQKFIESSFDWGLGYPSTEEVLYAQEDLWILNTVADIIKATNGDARTQATAAVKEIVSIKYGKSVHRNGSVIPPAAPPSAASGDEDELLDGTVDPVTDTTSDPDAGAEGGVKAKPHLAAGRYVDEKFQKINSVQELENKLDIAKRVPVQLRVRIDQRYLNRLLAACANSPLTYEVRQLRLNPLDPPTFGTGDFGAPVASTTVTPGYGDFGMGGGQTATVLAPEDVDRLDRVVELWGIIYIFNPVDSKLLNGDADDGGADVDDFAAN